MGFKSPAGANSAGISNDARVEIHIHAGRAPEHQLQRHLGAPRQPPGCRRPALGLSRECGWDALTGMDVGCDEGVWTGSGSAVRVVLRAYQIKRMCVETGFRVSLAVSDIPEAEIICVARITGRAKAAKQTRGAVEKQTTEVT
jgi:hypothetical protein